MASLVFLAGVTALGVVGCSVVVWLETGRQFNAWSIGIALLMTGWSVAGLAAVWHGCRGFFGDRETSGRNGDATL